MFQGPPVPDNLTQPMQNPPAMTGYGMSPDLIQALLSTYQQMQEQEAQATTQAASQSDKIQRYQNWGGKGLLGWAADAIGNRKADKLRPEHEKALQEALLAKSRGADVSDQIKRVRDLYQHGAEADMTQAAQARYRSPGDLERWMGATPEEQEKMQAYWSGRGKSRPGTKIEVNTEKPSAAWEKFQERAPDDLQRMQDYAANAEGFLRVADDVRAINRAHGTGRWQNIKAMAGEYFPENTDWNKLAGDRQLFDVGVNQALQLALEKMRGLGQMTEVEFEAATKELARFSNTREANEYIINLMESKARDNAQTYDMALEYMNNPEFERSGFARFRPANTMRRTAPVKGGPAAKAIEAMSEQELMAEIERRRAAGG